MKYVFSEASDAPVLECPFDVCPGFQNKDGFPHLHVLLPAYNGFLRFTYDATPADLLVADMVAGPFHPRTCTCIQKLMGLECMINLGAASQHVTRQLAFYSLTYAGVHFLYNSNLTMTKYPE